MNERIVRVGTVGHDRSLLNAPLGSLNIDGPIDYAPITYAIQDEVLRVMEHRAAVREVAATVALARVPWALHYAAPQLAAIITHHRKARP